VRKLLALIDSTNTWIGKVVCILSLVVAFIICYEIFVRQVLAPSIRERIFLTVVSSIEWESRPHMPS